MLGGLATEHPLVARLCGSGLQAVFIPNIPRSGLRMDFRLLKSRKLVTLSVATPLQGYLAHKKPRPPKTLQEDYAYEPTIVLGGGRFLMSEAPL